MKYPKKIYKSQTYWFLYRSDKPSKDEMTEYKFHGFAYKGCAEYIHWWQNPEGKWKPFKIFIEKGNDIYEALKRFTETGEQPDMYEFEF